MSKNNMKYESENKFVAVFSESEHLRQRRCSSLTGVGHGILWPYLPIFWLDFYFCYYHFNLIIWFAFMRILIVLLILIWFHYLRKNNAKQWLACSTQARQFGWGIVVCTSLTRINTSMKWLLQCFSLRVTTI